MKFLDGTRKDVLKVASLGLINHLGGAHHADVADVAIAWSAQQ